MPRRPPPTALRLVPATQLLPRGVPKHTLPSIPRPALMLQDNLRVTTWETPGRRFSLGSERTHAGGSSVYSSGQASSVASLSTVDFGATQPQPKRRQTERGLDSSGIGTKSIPAVIIDAVPGSRFTTPSPSPMSSEGSPASRGVMRGPWDHSRILSLPIDVGTVLPAPKPVAISP